MHVWNVLHSTRSKYRTQKIAIVPFQGLSPSFWICTASVTHLVPLSDSVQVCSSWPTTWLSWDAWSDNARQCWHVLLRQDLMHIGLWWKLHQFFGFHLCLVFFQSCVKFSSSRYYITFLTACTQNLVHTICNFLLLLLILWCTNSVFKVFTDLIATGKNVWLCWGNFLFVITN